MPNLEQIILVALAVMGLVTNLRINRIARNLCIAIIKGDHMTYRMATGTRGVPYEKIDIDSEGRNEVHK